MTLDEARSHVGHGAAMAKLFRTVTEMRQYPCRTCGAKPGESCRSLTAGRNTNPHQSRWEPEYGGDFADDEKPAQPRAYSFTRAQLVDALTRLETHVLISGPAAGMINAESMADAIIGALENGESAATKGDGDA